MDGSFKSLVEWKVARKTVGMCIANQADEQGAQITRWIPPSKGSLKVNVDASIFTGKDDFSVGMVLRDHSGSFISGKVLMLPVPASVFEGETIGVREALSWIMA